MERYFGQHICLCFYLNDMNKTIGKILIIISIMIIIGILIPVIFSFSNKESNVSEEIKIEANMSIPKILKLITVYQSFSVQGDGIIIAETRTLFNIKLQEIIFTPANEITGNIGALNIRYFPFSK